MVRVPRHSCGSRTRTMQLRRRRANGAGDLPRAGGIAGDGSNMLTDIRRRTNRAHAMVSGNLIIVRKGALDSCLTRSRFGNDEPLQQRDAKRWNNLLTEPNDRQTHSRLIRQPKADRRFNRRQRKASTRRAATRKHRRDEGLKHRERAVHLST